MSKVLRLRQNDLPTGVDGSTTIGWLSDLHIPYHDRRAVALAQKCLNDAKTDLLVFGGDIADSGVVSRHESKARKDSIDWGTLRKSAATGRDIIDWGRSHKKCIYIRGNHEAWIENKIKMDPGLRGSVTPEALLGWPEDGDGWTVLPSLSKVKIGSLNLEHLDGFFKKQTPLYPAANILRRAPHQTTAGGHCHRDDFCCHTTPNEHGIPMTREAHVFGHLSMPEKHEEYMGSYPNWQQSFGIIRLFWERGRAKYNVTHVRIYRDWRNHPAFEYNGRFYNG